jgi:hypothetical protein
MEISIRSLLEGAARATGTVAVIDVFRAFTTAAVALANGASGIIMVSTVEEALALREAGVGQVCMGEVHGLAPDGFEFGNSPFEVSATDFTGKTIIRRTSAGTQGIVAAAKRADRLSLCGHCASHSFRITRSDQLGRNGRQWPQTHRRGRGVCDPSPESPGRPAERSGGSSSADLGGW